LITKLVFETKNMINTKSIEINKLHNVIGHCGETQLKATANAYGIKVFEKLETCESCTMSNSREKKSNMIWTESRTIPEEYINSIKDESFGREKF
jgi:hypothetical protein